MNEITLDTTVSRADNIISSEIDGELVMMSIEHGSYYCMNDIASHIWDLIETPCRVGALVDTLMGEFEVDRATCETDVLNFFRNLQKSSVLNT